VCNCFTDIFDRIYPFNINSQAVCDALKDFPIDRCDLGLGLPIKEPPKQETSEFQATVNEMSGREDNVFSRD
jgi:hypothetical protein